MLTWISKHVVYPLREAKQGARRLKYLEELRASQWRSEPELRQAQWVRLKDIVAYAFDNVPYYRASFEAVGFTGQLRTPEEFRSLPLLSKHTVRKNHDALISRVFRRDELVESRTGGSTGTALTLRFDKPCQQRRNAAAMRSDEWAGWDIGMKVAAIWGNPPVPHNLRGRLRNALVDRTMYLDTMNVNDESVRHFVAAWRKYQPQLMFGHAHSIYILATYLNDMGVNDLRPKGIVSTSMMLLASERAYIQKTFECAVSNRYGCEEVGLIAAECERHEGLHINMDYVFLEFLRDDGREAQPGEEAKIVVTDLVNRGMPLIRYEVGDLGVPSDRRCSCGRGQPLMDRITGRQADFLKRPDGSRVAGVSIVERTLTAIPGLQQMQLVQNDLHKLAVKVVATDEFSTHEEYALRRELEDVFGEDVTVDLQYVEKLDQTRAGKYRFAICTV
jgi:phenylacetate-CoA ligase